MKQSLETRGFIARMMVMLVLLPCLGAIAITIAGGGSTKIYDPIPASESLSIDEKNYVDYISPRLQDLVNQMSQVTELVQQRSRNVISLNNHGVRISTLSQEIIDYGDQHGIPERFAAVDAEIRQGCLLATTTVQDARRSLMKFDFSSIPSLIPRFSEGSHKLTSGLTELRRLADASSKS